MRGTSDRASMVDDACGDGVSESLVSPMRTLYQRQGPLPGPLTNMARRHSPPKWLTAARLRERPIDTSVWLSRALSRAGVLPMQEAEAAISAGRVRVNGRILIEPYAPIQQSDRIELDLTRVRLAFRTRALMFHKPAGVLSHGSDRDGSPTVFEKLQSQLSAQLQGFGWHGIGRLDRNTTGLFLFTNDDRLVAHVTSPATHLEKRYFETVGGAITEAKLDALRRGVRIDDGRMTGPARAQERSSNQIELCLTEGRYHQVKRMLNAVGLATLALHREAIGKVVLDVELNRYRELSPTEISSRLSFDLPGWGN